MGTGTLLLLCILIHIGFCCVYFNGPDFSDQRLVIRRGREIHCIINKTTTNGIAVHCEGSYNDTATRVNHTHVLLKTNDDLHANFKMEYGKKNVTGKNAEPYTAGFCCVYFNGPDFSDQRLVIRRGREIHCIINKTTTNGIAVHCEGSYNDTATRVNHTHVLLKTNDDLHANFKMEYGKKNVTGKNAEPYTADCPDPSPVPGKVKNPDEKYRVYSRVFAEGGAVIFIIIIILIGQNYLDKMQAQNSNGNSASSSNDSSQADLMDGDMNKAGQV
ncbi:uncharacterized protein [Phyllobates terribilis]|uniref:uncharacterized protein n=1 Tax=Phyllobates terribilis TaxID=111132 RepID=UPI003CCA7F20